MRLAQCLCAVLIAVFLLGPAATAAAKKGETPEKTPPFALVFKNGATKGYPTVEAAVLDAVIYNGTHPDRCVLRERKDGKWRTIHLPKDPHPPD